MKISRAFKASLLLLLFLGISSAYVKAFTIAGPSMTPTYWYDDIVVSNHLAYDFRLPHTDFVLFETGQPERGDVIMYFDIPKNVVAAKRIIGIPGDTVSIKDNVVYLNGEKISQSIEPKRFFDNVPDKNGIGEIVLSEEIDGTSHLITFTPGAGKITSLEPINVTEGKYFILGDNRDNSADSRFIGLISRGQIKGKVIHGNRPLGSYALPSA